MNKLRNQLFLNTNWAFTAYFVVSRVDIKLIIIFEMEEIFVNISYPFNNPFLLKLTIQLFIFIEELN